MIALIDSGVGGVNVLVECAKLFNEDFVYLCDNLNAPYGNKKKKKLYNITKHNIDMLVSKYSLSAIVIACNTISFTVGEKIKSEYNVPIILMEINFEKLNNYKKDYLFFGTKNTLKNNKIIKNKIKYEKCCKMLYIRDLAIFIDNNLFNFNNIKLFLNKKIKINKYKNINTIILCCTHYKTIKKELLELFPSVQFFEYESDVALKVLRYAKPKQKRTFKILLTKKDDELYTKLKRYLIKNLYK